MLLTNGKSSEILKCEMKFNCSTWRVDIVHEHSKMKQYSTYI